MTVRPCAERGCPELVRDGYRCEKHRIKRERQRARRGSTARWRRRRRRILTRDGYRCVECGAYQPLEVDHIDGDPTNDDPENLQTLCTPCHVKKHGGALSRAL